ncbi:Uncharacterized protein APZ42_010872 [Daphnia magna]|uniref:Uncharacterized protein n=1 Tax=Daphnia magna TaxID=35525 RepID=A0A0P5GUZ6_9CRUS|nr:Uncharacterized protein APZ42_010872 [Daphnia magna]
MECFFIINGHLPSCFPISLLYPCQKFTLFAFNINPLFSFDLKLYLQFRKKPLYKNKYLNDVSLCENLTCLICFNLL